jgi:hypothetical protein
MSSPVAIMPLASSIPIVCAREGELGRGGTFGARLVEDWLPCERLVGEFGWPEVDEVGLLFGPGGLLAAPRNLALLFSPASSAFGPLGPHLPSSLLHGT